MKGIRLHRMASGFLFLAGLLLLSPSLLAQNGGFAGTSSRIGISARGMAMSNALSAVTSEGNYAYYNPAQTAILTESKQADLTAGALQFGRIFQTASLNLQLPPTAGLSFSILRTGVKDIDGRTQSGYPTGMFDASDYQLRTNFGLRLSDKMNAGIGIAINHANYHPELNNSTGVGIDFGLLYHAGRHLNLAFAIKDIFAQHSWNSQELYALEQARNVVNKFPTRFIWGAAYQKQAFTLSGDVEIQIYESQTENRHTQVTDGTPITYITTKTIATSSMQVRLGGAWNAHERFTLRGGWQLPDASDTDSWAFSSGFSLLLPFDVFSPSIDYAFVLEPYRVSAMHIFSLRLNL